MPNVLTPLTDLPVQINAAHAAAQAAVRDALGYAAEAGRLLLAAKAQLPHGRFGAWVAEHCAFAPRTARLYMQVARRWPELQAGMQNGNALPIREAQRLLATPRAACDPAPDVLANFQTAQTELDRIEALVHAPGDDPETSALLSTLSLEDCCRFWAKVVDDPLIHPGFRRIVALRVEVRERAAQLRAQLAGQIRMPVHEIEAWTAADFGALALAAKARVRELEGAA